jgi:hypothetical protein
MALQNVPTGLQSVIQGNWLNRRFERQLRSKAAFRVGAYRTPVPVRSGETTIYSRAGRLVPIIPDLTASANTGLDNNFTTPVGGVGATQAYSFEQYQVFIGQIGYPLDLNAIQQQELIADVFKQNWDNLAEQASLSLDLKSAQATFLAYESGRTWVRAATTASTTATVDNIVGFDTAFSTITVQGQTFPVGSPQPVSGSNTLVCTVYPASGAASYTVTVILAVADGSNVSSQQTGGGNGMINGKSGTLTFSAAQTFALGDVLVAPDAPAYVRNNNKRSRYAMSTSDTIGIQMVMNATAILRANNIPPMSDGTYAVFIDPVLMAQFFADQQFQIMAQGAEASSLFKDGVLIRHFGVTFVQTTNAPVYGPFTNFQANSLYTRRLIVCGERYIQECPFEGLEAGYRSLADYSLSDIRVMNDVAVITRPPLDRQAQILSQSWVWIGGFVAPTDATITSAVIPTATSARYKRAVVLEAASSF